MAGHQHRSLGSPSGRASTAVYHGSPDLAVRLLPKPFSGRPRSDSERKRQLNGSHIGVAEFGPKCGRFHDNPGGFCHHRRLPNTRGTKSSRCSRCCTTHIQPQNDGAKSHQSQRDIAPVSSCCGCITSITSIFATGGRLEGCHPLHHRSLYVPLCCSDTIIIVIPQAPNFKGSCMRATEHASSNRSFRNHHASSLYSYMLIIAQRHATAALLVLV